MTYTVTPEQDKRVMGGPKTFMSKQHYLKWRAGEIRKDNPAAYTTMDGEGYIRQRQNSKLSSRAGTVSTQGGKRKFVPKNPFKKRWS